MIAIRAADGRPTPTRRHRRVHVAPGAAPMPGSCPTTTWPRLSAPRQAAYYRQAIRAAGTCAVSWPEAAGRRRSGFVHRRARRRAASLADGEIETLYVLDDWREQGLGRRADAARRRRSWRQQGCRSVFLWVLRDNPSRWFYQRLGGRPVADGGRCRSPAAVPQTAYVWDPIDAALPRAPCCDHRACSPHDPDSATRRSDRVLILDFGSQFTQLIARRRARIRRVLRDPAGRRRSGADRGVRRPRRHPFRRPGQRDRGDRAARSRRSVFSSGLPVLGICYGQQAMCRAARRRGRASASTRSSAQAYAEVIERLHAVPWRVGGGRARAGLDEPWRPGDEAAAGLPGGGAQRGQPVRGDRGRCAAVLRRAVPSGGACTRRTARSCCRTSRIAWPGWPAAGAWRGSGRRRSSASGRRWGTGRVICGLSGGVD